MTRRRVGKGEVDRLLREALVDDLPPDAGERLRARMRPSWRAAVARVSAEESTRQGTGVVAAGSWRLQRALLAAALLALAVGGVVHLEAGAGPLAESFLAQQTAARVASQLHRVSAMRCRLETRDAWGRHLRFDIHWRDSGEADVRIEGPEAARQRTFRLPRETASFLSRARKGPVSAASRLDEPELDPAGAHLTPERLAGLLEGRWEAILEPLESRPDVATFDVSAPGRRGTVRVTIDTETDLPLSVEQVLRESEPAGPGHPTLTRAYLDWTLAESSPTLLNGRARSQTMRGRFPGS